MNLRKFKAGSYRQQYQYKSFSPVLINHDWVWDEAKINVLMEQATRALGELNAFSMIVPDVNLFIRMHIIKEANKSSRIEGTRTELDEALMEKEEIAPEKQNDWQEVQNYVKAINYAIGHLEKLPLSNRLLKDTHAILMEGVRGEHKSPGEYRTSQNWIGGSNLTDAIFIPPHHDEVPDLMSDLEKFWHNEQIDVPHLIRIAISHYQFETIHPFCDGNGRIGRLLITLYLVNHKLLLKPSLYLSDFFEKHRSSYYDALSVVRESNDLSHWIKFFLNGVYSTAQNGVDTFQKILKLKNQTDGKIIALGRRAENARKLIELLYQQPLISVNATIKQLNLNKRSARELIQEFEHLGILKEITGYKRNRLFLFQEYLDMF